MQIPQREGQQVKGLWIGGCPRHPGAPVKSGRTRGVNASKAAQSNLRNLGGTTEDTTAFAPGFGAEAYLFAAFASSPAGFAAGKLQDWRIMDHAMDRIERTA